MDAYARKRCRAHLFTAELSAHAPSRVFNSGITGKNPEPQSGALWNSDISDSA